MAHQKILATIVATVAASLCCVTPVLAVLAGSSTLASSFSWLAPYHTYLVWFTIAILVYAWYDKLKPSGDIDCACDEKVSFFSSKKFLTIVTVFSVAMLSFPQWGYKVFDAAPTAESCSTGACDSSVAKKETPDKQVKQNTPDTKTGSACKSESNCSIKPFRYVANAHPAAPGNKNALKVFNYMEAERHNPTPYNQKACSGYGRSEIDSLIRQARKEAEEMSPVVLKKMIDNEDEFILLDVREAAQRSEGEIYADESLQMSRGDLEFMIMNKIKDKEAVIVTYCRTGGRGLLAAQTLKKMGYHTVYTLKGGLKAWARAGFPFDNGLGVVVKVEEE
ncbi:MAG TPA: rhodanese-like domain-containing protein [Epsilonproteobacteria bacterium]|nr:rhodanese-like domain-containing protein [Campylobacterota bacterium]